MILISCSGHMLVFLLHCVCFYVIVFECRIKYCFASDSRKMNAKVKESKSSVTIRRRTHRIPNVASFLGFRTKSSAAAAVNEQQEISDDEESDAFAEHRRSFLAGPRMIRIIMSSQKTLFWSLVTFRLLNALMIQTSYVPDEYWQSIEVAHRMAFG